MFSKTSNTSKEKKMLQNMEKLVFLFLSLGKEHIYSSELLKLQGRKNQILFCCPSGLTLSWSEFRGKIYSTLNNLFSLSSCELL
jgi:hypothetical protein